VYDHGLFKVKSYPNSTEDSKGRKPGPTLPVRTQPSVRVSHCVRYSIPDFIIWLHGVFVVLTKNVLLTKSGKAVNSNTSDAVVVVIMGSIFHSSSPTGKEVDDKRDR
jgi:hypothetical protein